MSTGVLQSLSTTLQKPFACEIMQDGEMSGRGQSAEQVSLYIMKIRTQSKFFMFYDENTNPLVHTADSKIIAR